MIKTLIGVHPPTHGEGFIFGLDIRSDVATIQKIMGVCPQDDLLWLDLTARQHLELFARFKGVPADMIAFECGRVLDAVNLSFDVNTKRVDPQKADQIVRNAPRELIANAGSFFRRTTDRAHSAAA